MRHSAHRRIGREKASLPLWDRAFLLSLVLALVVLPAVAQTKVINPRIPPPPPPPEQSAPPVEREPGSQPAAQPKSVEGAQASGSNPEAEEAPPPSWPATVTIPAGTRIAVVLDTPLSTRIARRGQPVTFRTSSALQVHDQIELPPETPFTGTVMEAKRPGHFGKVGVLRVGVERLSLSTGTTTEIAAHLDSPDMKGGGRLAADNRRGTDLLSLGLYTLEGTLLGARINGGKGAAIGAGAGAAVALLILMSHRGADVYLEPGMPFLLIVDRPIVLPGKEVFAVQRSYAISHKGDGEAASDTGPHPGSTDVSENPVNADGTPGDPTRPKLKRRPKTPQP